MVRVKWARPAVEKATAKASEKIDVGRLATTAVYLWHVPRRTIGFDMRRAQTHAHARSRS